MIRDVARRFVGKALASAFLMSTLVSCGSDEVVAPHRPTMPGDSPALSEYLTLSMSVVQDTVSPGESVLLALDLVTEDTLYTLGVRLEGVFEATVIMDGSALRTGSHVIGFTLPTGDLAGNLRITCVASAWGGSVSAVDSVTVFDRVPPQVLMTPPDELASRSWIRIGYSWSDNAGVEHSVLRVSGAITILDSVHHREPQLEGHRVSEFLVVSDLPLGDSIVLELKAIDVGGLVSSQTEVVRLIDAAAPTVAGSILNGRPAYVGGPLFVTGDTIQLEVSASDDHRLSWIGYRFADYPGAADSSLIEVAESTATFSIRVPPEWHDNESGVGIFATDSSGNRSTGGLAVAFFGGIDRAFLTVEQENIGAVTDIVYDEKRGLLYLCQPDSMRIAVLSIETATYDAPIPLDGTPLSMDLTVGEDSLLVALQDSPDLAVVDLTGGVRAITLLTLTHVDFPWRRPNSVKVAANDKAMIGLTSTLDYGDTTAYWIDLRNGAQGLVPEAWRNGVVRRSSDRSVIMVGGNLDPAFYHANVDSLVNPEYGGWFGSGDWLEISATHILKESMLFDFGIHFVTNLALDERLMDGLRTAFNFSGDAAYVAIRGESGYRKVSVPDGSMIERVYLPRTLARFFSPNASTLVVLNHEGAPVFIVDER